MNTSEETKKEVLKSLYIKLKIQYNNSIPAYRLGLGEALDLIDEELKEME